MLRRRVHGLSNDESPDIGTDSLTAELLFCLTATTAGSSLRRQFRRLRTDAVDRATARAGGADDARAGFLCLFLVVPLAVVFVEAFSQGWRPTRDAIKEPDAVAALWLTLLAAAIAVPVNLVFGVAPAWAIAKFDFRGKQPADHADRSAVRRLAGDLGPGLRAAVRPAGLARAVAARARHQDHLRGARASCWRRSSCRSRSSRARSSR